jgi:hypothetical protein
MLSLDTKTIEEKLKRLQPEDAFIFLFYYTERRNKGLNLLPSKVGSVFHHKFLKEESAKDPHLANIAEGLATRKFTTFNSKANRMVKLVNECNRAGVLPQPYLPSNLQDKRPCLSDKIKSSFNSAPACPHVKTEFEWYDHQHRPHPKSHTIVAHRILFSSLVTERDVKYTWLSGSHNLEVSIRYPDMMNYPVELVDLVTDDAGNQVFHEQHPCISGFEKDLAARRESDGYCYETFTVTFDTEQDPKFVQINEKLKGFDLLRGKYVNSDDELCHFKILQIITKEKDVEEYREGEASISDCGVTIKAKKHQPSQRLTSPFSTTSPFSSPPTVVSQPDAVKPEPVMSSRLTTEQQQIAELQARLQSALQLADPEQNTNAQQEMVRMKAELESARQVAAQQAHTAAMQASAQQHATVQAAQAAIAERSQQAQAAIDQTNAQQQHIAQIQAELESARQAAAQQQVAAQQAQAAMEQAAAQQAHQVAQQASAQQHATVQAAQAAIAERSQQAQAAFEHTNTQQQHIAQMQAELESARQVVAQQQAVAQQAQAAVDQTNAQQQQMAQLQAELAAAKQAVAQQHTTAQETESDTKQRADIERARSKLAKRARADDQDEARFPSLRDAARQIGQETTGLHGADGFYPGVPAYVADDEKRMDDDMSTIDGGFSAAGLSLSSNVFS